MSPDAIAFDARAALERQLAIEWRFASDYILGQSVEELALWKPTANSVTVHSTDSGWVADWPDEEADEVAPATIGWLLWHIEWWWANTLATVNGGTQIAPAEFRWSGGADRIADLKRQWDEVLATRNLGELVRWVMPEPQPLGAIAGWVNFELAKNLSEINQLAMIHTCTRGMAL